jgi:hypothetical protein
MIFIHPQGQNQLEKWNFAVRYKKPSQRRESEFPVTFTISKADLKKIKEQG